MRHVKTGVIMRDYSDYDGVSNAERAAHLALATIGVRTVHSLTCGLSHGGGFALYWPPRWRGDELRPRATIGCHWEEWLPADIREELKNWRAAESWLPGTLDRREPREIQEPHRAKIIAWARKTHPALFAGAAA